jgi:hypothetical protein
MLPMIDPHGRIRMTDSGQSQIIVSGLNIVGGWQAFSKYTIPLTPSTQ